MIVRLVLLGVYIYIYISARWKPPFTMNIMYDAKFDDRKTSSPWCICIDIYR